MIVHENEAKKSMWCPMIRLRQVPSNISGYNRMRTPVSTQWKDNLFKAFFPKLHWYFRGKHYRCWGSNCMMWRWKDQQTRTGFCGLAGNPICED